MRLLLILILLIFTFSCKEDITKEQLAPLCIDLGNDTTLLCGETLLLDAGSGYASYRWNDEIYLDLQNINVSYPGIFWVSVEDYFGRTTSDTININYNFYQQTSSGCVETEKYYFLNSFSLDLTCDFYFIDCSIIDTYSYGLKSSNDNLKFSGDTYFPDSLATFDNIPTNFHNDYEYEILIIKGQEIGRCFVNKLESNINKGIFLFYDGNKYIQLFRVSFTDSMRDKAYEILSSIKNQ